MKRLSRSDSQALGTKFGQSARQPSRASRAQRLSFEHLEDRRVLAGWVESMGGAADETFFGYHSQQTMGADGDVYLSGRFYSQPADFDPRASAFLMSSAGGADAFASKYRADGSLVWARRFGGAGEDGASASAFASEAGTGYLYVAGTFEGSVNFGSGITLASAGGSDIFVAKLNAATGATIFAKRVGSKAGSEYVYDLAVANNQVFVSGTFDKMLDFDPGPGSALRSPTGQKDGFILQLNSTGDYVSSYQLGGNDADWILGMVAEATSPVTTSVYLAGALGPNSGTVDLDPGPAVKNATGRFIAKYSIPTNSVPNWSPNWVGSIGTRSASNFVFTDADSLYFVGNFQGTQDFDPGPETANLTAAGGVDGTDGVVARYSKNDGSFIWAQQYGGTGQNENFKTGIVVQSPNPANNMLYLGFKSYSASLDFNPAAPGGEVSGNAALGYDVLLKLNAQTGAYQQIWQTSSTGATWSHVAGTYGTSVYVAGYFGGTANFPTGQSLTSAGGSDIFLMALEDPTLGPPNAAPIANAGLPLSGNEDDLLVFNASASSDPEGDALTYSWNFGDGQTTVPSTSPTVSHAYAYGGTFSVVLTVDDGHSQSTATITATVMEVNDIPVANAGGPYSGFAGALITVDATNSFDFDNLDGSAANNQVLSYIWDFGDGAAVVNTQNLTYQHAYAVAGSYNVTLTINDGVSVSTSSIASVIINVAPSGNPNHIYVWDITFDMKSRGKSIDYQIIIDVHRDSDANGLASSNDSGIAGVMVTVELRNPNGSLFGIYSGLTDAQGIFRSSWIRGLSNGNYRAEVVDMALASYYWNHALDPFGKDADNDGLPDDVLIVS